MSRSIDNLSPFELWQMKHYGDILPTPTIYPAGDIDTTQVEFDRFEEWSRMQEDKQLHENDLKEEKE